MVVRAAIMCALILSDADFLKVDVRFFQVEGPLTADSVEKLQFSLDRKFIF